MQTKLQEIRDFCIKNSDQSIIDKYSRYFKEGFDGFGIDQKVYEKQRDLWISEWQGEMSLNEYLDLGDRLVEMGKFEEISFAISFIKSERKNYTPESFNRITHWFELGISNWADTDVLCMLVLSSFFEDQIIGFDKFKEWTKSNSEWQRRAVPVTLVELCKTGLNLKVATDLIAPLMLDPSEYVQKGLGTLLRTLWKTQPKETEAFLLKWKDKCGRLIIQYATEKMDKEYRKKFRKAK